ncbi:MAG: aldolase [Candidatus Rokubacteria bacterium]|nr:aldolase [Candidatus Rokubacteria bacterium]
MFLERIDPERSGRFAFLAYDQGLEHGPEDFRSNPPSRSPAFILELAKFGYNAVVFQQGTALATRELCREVPRLIKLNGKANLSKGEPYSPLLCPVDYAVRELGARAVGYTLYPGSEHDAVMMREFAGVVREARDHGVPVIAWVYPRGKAVAKDTAPEVVAYAARIAFELGADIAKVKWTGDVESFRWVCQAAAETKVVLSGGVKTENPADFLAVVTGVIEAGGAGVAVGRNVWQRPREEAHAISKDILKIVGNRGVGEKQPR